MKIFPCVFHFQFENYCRGLNHMAAMLSRDTEKALFYHPVKNLGTRLGR